MALISFAQNQEDVMLWRALRHVREGFYIDVGAADPDDLSVTKVFYELGWHGINVEPSATYFAALSKARPRDINLRIGVGREAGFLTFFHVIGTGLSTFDREIAMDHRTRGWEVVEETVETLTLAEICRRHRPHDPIHFLKIDVEGTEGDVLAGGDFTAFRPWIVLVEATLPLSQQESHAGWDTTLTGHGYSFVWFDGLNRFYLSEEMKAELEPFFRVPPNIFDSFVSIPELVRRAEQNEQGLQAARAEVMQTARVAAETLQRAAQAGEQSADAVRRAVEAVQQTAATSAQQSALLVEAQRQSVEVQRHNLEMHQQNAETQRHISDLVRHRDALALELAEARARHAALSGAHEHLSASLAEAERLRREGTVALGGAEERARQSEELLRQMWRSTSWRVTAPLRGVRRLLPGAPAPRSGSGRPKEFARRAFHRSVRLFLWLPGGRLIQRSVRAVAPVPVEWLALRYRAYEGRAAMLPGEAAGSVTREAADSQRADTNPMSVPNTHRVADGLSSDASPMADADLSQEEARLYRQLLPAASSSESLAGARPAMLFQIAEQPASRG